MDFQLHRATVSDWSTWMSHPTISPERSLWVIFVPTQQDSDKGTSGKKASPYLTVIQEAIEQGDFDPVSQKTAFIYRPVPWRGARVLLMPVCGGQATAVRSSLEKGLAELKHQSIERVVFALGLLPETEQTTGLLQAVVQAMFQTSYRMPNQKCPPEAASLSQAKKSSSKSQKSLGDRGMAEVLQYVDALVSTPEANLEGQLRPSWNLAIASAWGTMVAKDLANLPANVATPSALAQAAEALAMSCPQMRCEIMGPRDVEKLGMGAFLSVAKGSSEPLRFIVLHYHGQDDAVTTAETATQGKPAKTQKTKQIKQTNKSIAQAPIVLIGKGITFDSGGISLKPAPDMDLMKFDMSGAASVLGVFAALARHPLPLHIVGLIPSCENLPSGQAVKPGDVIRSMSGQTIEVLNTDAEGRLLLCDALTYAQRFEPVTVIDIATLTGACAMALGQLRAGLFSSSDALGHALWTAGEVALDPCWPLPLDEAYSQGLTSQVADVANIGGRQAGAITAAKFLQRFVGDHDWAHLDIAGVAYQAGVGAGKKGATGRPVYLLMNYLAQCANAHRSETL
jgi:leucyl aminopeptidase